MGAEGVDEERAPEGAEGEGGPPQPASPSAATTSPILISFIETRFLTFISLCVEPLLVVVTNDDNDDKTPIS
jgi:hypothetical protein